MNEQDEKTVIGEIGEEQPEEMTAAPETDIPETEEAAEPETTPEAEQAQEENEPGGERFPLGMCERLELELWRAGIRQPQAVIGRFDLSALHMTPDGRIAGFSEQLAAIRAENAGAALGSGGNFIRLARGEKPGLREAIDRHYRR